MPMLDPPRASSKTGQPKPAMSSSTRLRSAMAVAAVALCPIADPVAAGRCASCTGRTRRAISSSAARSFGSSPARASASACAGTGLVGRSTPSKRIVYSRTAAAPRSRTSSHTGRICAMAAPVSSAARGRTLASFSLVIPAAGCSRRSRTESTRLVYGASTFARRTVHLANDRGHPPGPVPARAGQQFEAAGHRPGGQHPEPERAGRAERQRIAQPGADRQGRQQVLECGEPGVLPHPARHERGGKRPGEQPGHRQRPALAHGEQVPERPEITPPARHTRQNAASAAMNAVVSVLTRAAAPGAVITSSARGATAAQPSPATTPSAAVPAATASAATTAGTASRHRQERTASSPRAGSEGNWHSMVASSVRDMRAAGHGGRFEADRKPCYGELRDTNQSSDSVCASQRRGVHSPRRAKG